MTESIVQECLQMCKVTVIDTMPGTGASSRATANSRAMSSNVIISQSPLFQMSV